MSTKKKNRGSFLPHQQLRDDFFEKLWDESWIYVKTVVDAGQNPLLILDDTLTVLVANKSFFNAFHIEKHDIAGTPFHLLKDGQWNTPTLHTQLKEVLTKGTSFKGFEISHASPPLGRQVLLLSARQMYYKKNSLPEDFSPVILLAFEDITKLVSIAESLAAQLNKQRQHD